MNHKKYIATLSAFTFLVSASAMPAIAQDTRPGSSQSIQERSEVSPGWERDLGQANQQSNAKRVETYDQLDRRLTKLRSDAIELLRQARTEEDNDDLEDRIEKVREEFEDIKELVREMDGIQATGIRDARAQNGQTRYGIRTKADGSSEIVEEGSYDYDGGYGETVQPNSAKTRDDLTVGGERREGNQDGAGVTSDRRVSDTAVANPGDSQTSGQRGTQASQRGGQGQQEALYLYVVDLGESFDRALERNRNQDGSQATGRQGQADRNRDQARNAQNRDYETSEREFTQQFDRFQSRLRQDRTMAQNNQGDWNQGRTTQRDQQDRSQWNRSQASAQQGDVQQVYNETTEILKEIRQSVMEIASTTGLAEGTNPVGQYGGDVNRGSTPGVQTDGMNQREPGMRDRNNPGTMDRNLRTQPGSPADRGMGNTPMGDRTLGTEDRNDQGIWQRDDQTRSGQREQDQRDLGQRDQGQWNPDQNDQASVDKSQKLQQKFDKLDQSIRELENAVISGLRDDVRAGAAQNNEKSDAVQQISTDFIQAREISGIIEATVVSMAQAKGTMKDIRSGVNQMENDLNSLNRDQQGLDPVVRASDPQQRNRDILVNEDNEMVAYGEPTGQTGRQDNGNRQGQMNRTGENTGQTDRRAGETGQDSSSLDRQFNRLARLIYGATSDYYAAIGEQNPIERPRFVSMGGGTAGERTLRTVQ
ncbi:MAG: hypothetical protein RLY93_08480 [Sumerlaeia bacterium]